MSRLLGDLSRSYACVACVSGRPALEARRLVGEQASPTRAYTAPNCFPRARTASLAASFQSWRGCGTGFHRRACNVLQALGARIEDKGPIVAFHWRGVADEEAAVADLELVADAANEAGLSARWGRKVLEVWPPVRIGKGRAVCELVRASQGAGGTVRRRRRHRP